jgi:hypothetical protein
VLSPTGADLPPLVTKFGGTPYLAPGEAWPKCATGSCYPTTFVCQIDLAATALGPLGPARLIQLFACYECGRRQWLTRAALPPRREAVPVPEARAFVPQCAVAFETVPSLPDWDTIDQFAPGVSDLSVAMNRDAPWEGYARAAADLGVEFELRTSVGGYPKWLQGNDWPAGKRFVAQIDSEAAAELVWGDHGLLYLFANPDGSDLAELDQCM